MSLQDSPTATIAIVAQAGRLSYEALLFTASLAAQSPSLARRLVICEPLPGGAWPEDVRISDTSALRDMLRGLGARFQGFETRHFGAAYPYGNKIEALLALPEGAPFVFFDTDTLFLAPLETVGFDFARPSASVRVEATWPEPQPYHASYATIWKSLYDRFGLDYAASLDPAQPEEFWKRHLYFNAGWFFGPCPRAFGQRFLDYALAIRDTPGDMLAAQALDPWLDQIALPLVVSSFGGGRPGPELAGLDGEVSCHYRTLPLLYARESDRVIEVLEALASAKELRRILRDWEPAKVMIYQNRGRNKVRPLFDQNALPAREQVLRNTLKREGLWLR